MKTQDIPAYIQGKIRVIESFEKQKEDLRNQQIQQIDSFLEGIEHHQYTLNNFKHQQTLNVEQEKEVEELDIRFCDLFSEVAGIIQTRGNRQ